MVHITKEKMLKLFHWQDFHFLSQFEWTESKTIEWSNISPINGNASLKCILTLADQVLTFSDSFSQQQN